MPGHRVGAADELGVVTEREPVHAPRLLLDPDAEIRRRRAGLQVVISLDEHDVERRI